MPAGRPRKPSKLKKIQGTVQPCREKPAEPDAIPPSLIPPLDLHANEREVWVKIATVLDQAGVLSQTDRESLKRYARLQVRWAAAGELVNAEGMVLDTPRGKVKNPAMMLELDIGAQLFRLENEFGMTPASRSRVADRRKKGSQDADEERIFGT